MGEKDCRSSKKLSGYSDRIRQGFGIPMILAALAMAFHYDVKFQQIAVRYVPLINIEDNAAVAKALDELRKNSSVNVNKSFILPSEESVSKTETVLPKILPAPELVGILGWINSDPLTLNRLRGKVVFINFGYLINCIRTFLT